MFTRLRATGGTAVSAFKGLWSRGYSARRVASLGKDGAIISDVFDLMSEGLVLLDAEGRFVFCNQTYRDFYQKITDLMVPGTPFETIIRASIERGQFAESANETEDIVRHRVGFHSAEHGIHIQQLCDGRWLRVTERRLQNGWVLGIRSDISEMKERESALDKTRRQLVDAIEALQEGFVLFDPEDRLVICNEKYRKLFPLIHDLIQPGASFEDLIRGAAERGQNVEAVAHREDWIEARLSAHALATGTFEHQFTDGRHVWVSEHKTRDGCTLSTYVDITELKNREEELIEAKTAAEEANRAKTDFLAKMSHELRTPLNAVIGFSEMIRNEMFGPIQNADYKGYVHDIHTSGVHLLTMINDLLDISKIEAGRMRIDETEVDLAAAVESCRRTLAHQAELSDIRLDVDLPAETPTLLVDEHAFIRILLNLVSNAIKFTPSGGKVSISCDPSDSGDIVVRVTDNGIGISEQDLPRVVEPFIQATTISDKGGTGLGLPITKHLVEMHGGRLEIESVVGEGTSVAVRLPLRRGVADRAPSAPPHVGTWRTG